MMSVKTIGMVISIYFGFLLSANASETALEEYVYRLDSNYEYTMVDKTIGPGYTVYLLNMTSQAWRAETEVSPTVWTHWVRVIIPDVLLTTSAHLIITGGDMSPLPPNDEDLALFAPIALSTASVAILLSEVPGQPLQFVDKPDPIREDALVAYSWRKVMETGDATWAAYFPMTKAAVRTMDTAEHFLQDVLGAAPSGFIVTGFSKRGATAWLTAAIDSRVQAVVPGVFNAMHFEVQFENQYRNYGDYASAAIDYSNERVLQNIRSPEGKLLTAVVDPIHYVDRLTMPHYILQASGDQFFLPDASRSFIQAIPGEVTQRIVPNEDHSLSQQIVPNISALIAWYQSVLLGSPRPVIEEVLRTDGVLEVTSDQPAMNAVLWQAHNPEKRDFRLETLGPEWKETPISADDDGVYRVSAPPPSDGYTAYMVEFTYPGTQTVEIRQQYTTSTYVTPDSRPFVLQEDVNDPKTARYWLDQVIPGEPNGADFSEEALRALLPIRVLGTYITDLDRLRKTLRLGRGSVQRAMRQCTAARLNVESRKVGWYSTVWNWVPYWKVIDFAEQQFDEGQESISAALCYVLTIL
ncbi:MAG: PhoPQ-activated protein PqaA family protein [Gammaproteobacteria bacterium]